MKTMKQKGQTAVIVVMVVLVLAIGALVAFFATREPMQNVTESPVPTETDTVSPTPTIPSNGAGVPADWQTFTSEEFGFSMRYPDEIEFEIDETQRDAVRFVHLGPTQREGTEVYDGIILTFSTAQLDGQTLRQHVEEQHDKMSTEPSTQETSKIEQITIAGMQGYQFDVTGLGIFTHIYLPKDEDELLHITKLVEDPEDQGFEETTGQMLSTISYTE